MIKIVNQKLAEVALLEQIAAARKANPALLTSGAVLITRVLPDGQAAAAGIALGDILILYNATRLDKADTLRRLEQSTATTKLVTIEVLRGAQKLLFKVRGGMLGVIPLDLSAVPVAHL
jgi:S1-C subfamily serine protease